VGMTPRFSVSSEEQGRTAQNRTVSCQRLWGAVCYSRVGHRFGISELVAGKHLPLLGGMGVSMKHTSQKKSETAITVDLECLRCHTRVSAEVSGKEFKKLSAAWKLTRNCDSCGQATDWSFAEAAVEAEEQVDFWDWLAMTGESLLPREGARQDERRAEPRVDLQVPLRIEGAEGEEEVFSENISKSGFAFCSPRSYPVGETLRVTIQSPGAPAPQTKRATIVRANPAPGGKTVYGVRLLT